MKSIFKPFFWLTIFVVLVGAACQFGGSNPLVSSTEGPDLEATIAAQQQQLDQQKQQQDTEGQQLPTMPGPQSEEALPQDENGESPSDGDGEASGGFVTLTDETGYISMDVPADWIDVDTSVKEWQLLRNESEMAQELKEPMYNDLKAQETFKVPRIEASTNLEDFRMMFWEDSSIEVEPTKYDAPGVRLTLSDIYGKRIPVMNLLDMRQRLPKDTEGRQCEIVSNPTGKPYEDYMKKEIAGTDVYSVYTLWKNCGGFGGPFVAVVVARPYKDKDMQKWGLLLEIQSPKGYTRDQFVELMDTMMYSIKLNQEF